MKKKLYLIPLLFLIVLLAGCAWKLQGQYFSDSEFTKEIEKYTGTEKVTILNREEEPGHIRYTVRTDKRELEFEVFSFPAGNSGLYNPANINVYSYLHTVHALYDEQIKPIIDELYMDNKAAVFSNRRELHVLIERIVEIDEIYKQELEYHDAKWLEKFPYTCVSLSRRDPGKKKGDFSYGVKIDGTINAEELEELLCNLYKERTGQELNNE